MFDDDSIFIVGIAASAGGLEALTGLVQNLPPQSDAAYVIAQHMAPNHKSMMPTLISRETSLKVVEIEGSVVPERNTIYLGPANNDVTFDNGKLVLREPSKNVGAPKPSADRLFKSLAEGLGPRCAGVVLSGTGSDGSYGIKDIRAAGGITIAQDLGSAKYDGMPASAAETGCIDLVLSPNEIGENIGNILDNPGRLDLFRNTMPGDFQLTELFQILLAHTRVDFRDYKETTLRRRLQRRMIAMNITSFQDYVSFCRSSQSEVEALFRDLLISVTRFFRDPDQFAALREQIQIMIKDHDRNSGPIRMWVPGCATGEEAYSIAALAADALGGIDNLSRSDIQLFATDLDEAALAVARQGIYPLSAAEDIPQDLLTKYFEVQEGHLIVKKALREVIFFSKHNLIQDPPFLNLCLVTLRNVLIYFNSRLQETVLGRLHYSLAPQGVMFLGSSESIGALKRGFDTISEQNKLYRKRLITFADNSAKMSSVSWMYRPHQSDGQARAAQKVDTQERDLQQAMFDALSRSMAGNSLLVSPSHDVVRVYGDLSEFIELSQNSKLDMNLSLLKSPLREEAANLCSLALRKKESKRGLRHSWKPGVGPISNKSKLKIKHRVWLEAFPIVLSEYNSQFVLLAIHREKVTNVPDTATANDSKGTVHQLREELITTRDALQQSIEELQTSNEELQSLNMEMQSSNEELQATNEEFETSNEELQSTNEELVTVNEELQVYSEELKASTAALSSVLRTAPATIVVVDTGLQILNASKSATEMFRLPDPISPKTHLTECIAPLGFPSLAELGNETLRLRHSQVREFNVAHKQFSISTTPFTDANGALRGVTLVVSEAKSELMRLSERELNERIGLLDVIAQAGHWRLDLTDKSLWWSDKLYEILGRPITSGPPDRASQENYVHEDDIPKLNALIRHDYADQQPRVEMVRGIKEDGTEILLEEHVLAIHDEKGIPKALLGIAVDVSSRQRVQQHQEEMIDLMHAIGFGRISVDVASGKKRLSAKLRTTLGLEPEKDIDAEMPDLSWVHTDFRDRFETNLSAAISKGENFVCDVKLLRKDGTEFFVWAAGIAQQNNLANIASVHVAFLPAETLG